MGLLCVVDYCGHCIVCLYQFFALNLSVLIYLHRYRVDIVHQLFGLTEHFTTLSYDFCVEVDFSLQPKCIFIEELLLLALLTYA